MRAWALAGFAVATLMASGCSPAPGPAPGETPTAQPAAVEDKRPKSYALIGQPIPPFRAALSAGGSLTEADLKGKWTVIDFWGIWCPDCMRDADHTAALARAIAQDPDLRFVSVHVDRRTASYASVQDYVAQKQITYPVMLDPERALYRAFQIQWVPSYLVVDPDGLVRGFRTDLSTETDPQGGVKKFLQDIAALRAAG
jgi:peroxiredoxin